MPHLKISGGTSKDNLKNRNDVFVRANLFLAVVQEVEQVAHYFKG